jgi:hypothetical protein
MCDVPWRGRSGVKNNDRSRVPAPDRGRSLSPGTQRSHNTAAPRGLITDDPDEVAELIEFCATGRIHAVRRWIAAGRPLQTAYPDAKPWQRLHTPLAVAVESGQLLSDNCSCALTTITPVHREEVDVIDYSAVAERERRAAVESHGCTGEEAHGGAREAWTSWAGIPSSGDASKHGIEVFGGGQGAV